MTYAELDKTFVDTFRAVHAEPYVESRLAAAGPPFPALLQ